MRSAMPAASRKRARPLAERQLPLFVPHAALALVFAHSFDRIARGPLFQRVSAARAGFGIVAGGVATHAIVIASISVALAARAALSAR